MDFEEILRIVDTSPLAEASKAAIKEVIEKARPNGSLSEEEKEQILAIFELEDKELEFEIDEHPKIPPFMEIEAPSPKYIEKTIAALGLQDHEQTADSIGELLRRKYKKVKLNGLVF